MVVTEIRMCRNFCGELVIIVFSIANVQTEKEVFKWEFMRMWGVGGVMKIPHLNYAILHYNKNRAVNCSLFITYSSGKGATVRLNSGQCNLF